MKPTSVDMKPLFAPHGTIIQEDDTKDYYIFDAKDQMWKKVMEPYASWLKSPVEVKNAEESP